MKTIELSNTDRAFSDLLRQARDDDLVLQTADGEKYFLSAIDEFEE